MSYNSADTVVGRGRRTTIENPFANGLGYTAKLADSGKAEGFAGRGSTCGSSLSAGSKPSFGEAKVSVSFGGASVGFRLPTGKGGQDISRAVKLEPAAAVNPDPRLILLSATHSAFAPA